MCGIVGYIGKKDAFPILIKGLRRLEYRGYDSAGVALINDNGNLNVCKAKGKVDNLVEYCSDKDVSVLSVSHIPDGRPMVSPLPSMRILIIRNRRILPLSIMVSSRTMLT